MPLFLMVISFRTPGGGLDGLDFFSWDFIVGLLLASAFLWTLCALFAFVLLIPLKPIADRARAQFSMPLFLVVGFVIPALIENDLSHMPTHGGPPPFDTQSTTELALSIVSAGIIGAGCALASWLSIRKSRPSAVSPGA